ncbi:hypothetical protein [Wolbachia endosymbiont of Folsomia candida]|uniref:hypothetical protein n=1 Tax=Wolbachia endosymbiont of Folsomia candida TaxID=169402 RepID=UPI000A8E7FAB|nr:hypothetical protein [Wolbachia endosymbiont of Folsomia candida]APR97746.1 hypothetical protein ASM33_00085 [Wolbachia endosymbiont of Folsomia candida]
MKINLSEENSKRVLSGTKWLTNAGQNYFTSLNDNQASNAKPTGSVKKVVNTILLVPIIVPTVLTVLSFGFVMLLLNAVNAQKNDSTLSKIAKGTAKLLIYIAAAVLLITCIILNLVISLIPFLIFLAINKDIFNQKSVNIASNQGQAVNEVNINDEEEYNQRIEEEVGRLEQQNNGDTEQYQQVYSQALVGSGQLYNQPTVEVISREVVGPQAIDQTVIAKRINSDDIRDGKAMIRTAGNDRSVTMKGIVTGDIPDQEKGFATGFSFECETIEKDGKVEGVDFQFGMSMRTGDNQQEATQALMRSKSVRTML